MPSGLHVFANAENWPALLRAIFNRKPFPVFLLRPDFSVAFMNLAAGKDHLNPGLTVSGQGSLRLGSASADEALAKSLKTLAKRPPCGDPHILPFELADGVPRVLRIETLPISGLGLNRSEAPASWFDVSLRSSQTRLCVSPERIAAAFQLTAAEASLALALAEGLSLHDYAARERLKITTVRWHLQNIFNRTGARSQASLIRMMVSIFA